MRPSDPPSLSPDTLHRLARLAIRRVVRIQLDDACAGCPSDRLVPHRQHVRSFGGTSLARGEARAGDVSPPPEHPCPRTPR